MTVTADFNPKVEDGKCVLRFSGNLTLLRVRKLTEQLGEIEAEQLIVDLSDVERMDTVGAWLVHKLERDRGARIVGATEDQQTLIDHVARADQPVKVRREYEPPLRQFVGEVGAATQTAMATMVGLLGFFGALLISTGNIIRHPRRFRFNAVVQRFDVVGVRALGIIGLMSFLVGIVIAQQGAVQLRQFGAEVFTINLIGRSAVKELGVLMTAIMIAGRSGSAITAEIGSMKMREEVDALTVIGLNPIGVLVFPRLVALVIVLPCLTVASNLAAVGGAIFVSQVYSGISPATFLDRMQTAIDLSTVFAGLIKAPFMAIIIGILASVEGLKVGGSAESLGRHVTAAVVKSIFVVIVVDGLFAMFYAAIDF